jgi:hypothetical protein
MHGARVEISIGALPLKQLQIQRSRPILFVNNFPAGTFSGGFPSLPNLLFACGNAKMRVEAF